MGFERPPCGADEFFRRCDCFVDVLAERDCDLPLEQLDSFVRGAPFFPGLDVWLSASPEYFFRCSALYSLMAFSAAAFALFSILASYSFGNSPLASASFVSFSLSAIFFCISSCFSVAASFFDIIACSARCLRPRSLRQCHFQRSTVMACIVSKSESATFPQITG